MIEDVKAETDRAAARRLRRQAFAAQIGAHPHRLVGAPAGGDVQDAGRIDRLIEEDVRGAVGDGRDRLRCTIELGPAPTAAMRQERRGEQRPPQGASHRDQRHFTGGMVTYRPDCAANGNEARHSRWLLCKPTCTSWLSLRRTLTLPTSESRCRSGAMRSTFTIRMIGGRG
jgi:hypothetical protein